MRQQPASAVAAAAVEYAALAVLVGGVFLVVVVGGGTLVGVDVPHGGFTLLAAGLLAVVFEPARRRVRRLVNRLLYGHRSSPWEAMSRLSRQMGSTGDPVDLLRDLSGVVRSGTGARRALVWLRIDSTWQPAAGSPDIGGAQAVAADGDRLPRPLDTALAVPIRHGGELLGAITVVKSGTAVIPVERRLVADLASHAGVVTRTLHLLETLQHRLDLSRRRQQDLVTARAEVVLAQDAERRRLARDMHDTCQQRAVVLAGRLALARAVVHRDPDEARAALQDAAADVDSLATGLRRLTAATPPPELAAGGVAGALRAETATLPFTVDLVDGTRHRFRAELEETVYFCCMEAIQNAVKHASPSRIRVRLAVQDGWLAAEVSDDGPGFDAEHASPGAGLANMRERVRRWDGQVAIRSSPAGTTVEIRVPAEAAG